MILMQGERKNFLRDQQGHVALLIALLLVPLLLGAGGAVDFSRANAVRSALQEAADAAALGAAASRGSLSDKQTKARRIFLQNLKNPPADVDPVLSIDGPRHTVSISHEAPTAFLKIVGMSSIDVSVASVAQTLMGNACLLALDETASNAVRADSNAQITANNCDIRVNSSNSDAIAALSASEISAKSICVKGGYEGSALRYSPTPETDCVVVADPLRHIAPPAVGGCNHTNLVIENQDVSLNGGVYCGGITLRNNSDVTLSPGVYVISGGAFTVDSNSSISGDGVMFYLTGAGAVLFFDSNSTVDLSAPDAGDHEGILFFEDRAQTPLAQHRILSNNVARMLGVIHLSRGTLVLDSNSVIGAGSAWTSVIVRRLSALSNVRLVLNADYQATTVRPPPGLTAGQARLIQ